MAGKKGNRKRYTAAEKRAYWIGYGAGLTVDKTHEAPQSLIDERLSRGQRTDLIASARAGIFAGNENRVVSAPFEKGFKRYPVTKKAMFADMEREQRRAMKAYAEAHKGRK